MVQTPDGDPGLPTPANHGEVSRPPDSDTVWLAIAPKVLDVVTRTVCLLAGFALLVSGVVGLFTETDTGALIAVLVAGALLLLLPSIVDRLSSGAVGAGGVTIDLLEQVVAAGARQSAQTLQKLGLDRQTDTYARLYTELSGDTYQDIRAQLLDRIVAQVATASAVEKFDKAEVRSMFFKGTPVMRVMALGLMKGDLSLVDADVLLESVSRSLTGNEQYHALDLTLRAWDRLASSERQVLKAAAARSVHLQQGSARRTLADTLQVLPEAGSTAQPPTRYSQ